MNTPITPAGWYDDGHGSLRWWDGSVWTDHTAPLKHEPAGPAAPAAAETRVEVLPPATKVEVKSSAVWWAVPIALLVSAVLGGLCASVVWRGFDPAPLNETFDRYTAAIANKDCAEFEAVTTPGFREDLTEAAFDCEIWMAANSGKPTGKRIFGFRIGPVGMLAVTAPANGRGVDPNLDSLDTAWIYSFERVDGKWLLSDIDDESDGSFTYEYSTSYSI